MEWLFSSTRLSPAASRTAFHLNTFGDVPPIETILIEDPEPLGPYGAKGIGEPALIPTAPAIFGAVYHATGVRLRFAPATPHRVREAILAARGEGGSDA